MSIPWDKLKNLRVGFGRVEANYIATNPLIFEELKIGDMLVCIEKDDYFRMSEGILELLAHINELYAHINKLHKMIDPKLMKEARIQQLKGELEELENE